MLTDALAGSGMGHHEAGVVVDLKRSVLAVLDNRLVNGITGDTARCHFSFDEHHIARGMKRRGFDLEVGPELTDGGSHISAETA